MHIPASARLLALAVVGVVLVSGCTDAQAPAAASSIEIPDLGPLPASDVLTPDQIEQERLAGVEASWLQVTGSYPDAVRPDAAFVGFTPGYTYVDALDECYIDSGLALDRKTDEVGVSRRTGTTVRSEADAVAVYLCQTAVVVSPPPMNAAQIGYYYDYLTEFLAPCYAANDIGNAAAPERETYIASWPSTGWFPGLGDLYGTAAAAAVIDACPKPFS
ncbi:hypothetical protein HD599_000960 [Conyzicola lurida]|uniref:Lipoprotein n=1 Tax=Conyzicola lurida TaxID=1172621 RepID=A0A841AHD6_9MICO|nr:hypothetical protein [Conyzicola lurida]MBB5842637.1 hypothetical protein [Conyzicola lurida]